MSSPTAAPEKTYQRIADHAVAYARFEASCTPADEVAAKKKGRKVTPEQLREYEEADQAEGDTFTALLLDVPRNTVQLRRKVRYLQMHMRDGNYLTEGEQELFLTSLLEFSPESYA